MREAQREYFSTRSHETLQKARSLERSVDAIHQTWRANQNWGAPTDKDVFIMKFHEYENN